MTGTGTQADPFVVDNWDDFVTAIETAGAWVELDNSASNKVIDMSEHGFFSSAANTSAISLVCKDINGNGWEIRSLSWDSGALFGGSPSSDIIIDDLYFTSFNSVCSNSSNNQMFHTQRNKIEFNDCQFSGEIENSSLFYCYSGNTSLNRCSLNVNLKASATICCHSYAGVYYTNCNIKITGNTNRQVFRYSTFSFCYISGFLNFTSTVLAQFNVLGATDYTNRMHTVVDINVNNTGISTNTIKIYNKGYKIVNTDKIVGFATVMLTDETCAVTSAQLEDENYLKSIGFAIGVEGGGNVVENE